MFTLHISRTTLNKLYAHAERALPIESVALLFGRVQDDAVVVKRAVCVENTVQSPTRFAVNPEVQYGLLLEAEARREQLVAIFHSHPAPPRPSNTDMHYMRLNPVIWIIASNVSGTWASRAFLLQNDSVENVRMKILG